MNNKVSEVLVGVFLLCGVLAIVFLAFRVGNMGLGGSGDSFNVRANFDNIGGLNVKAPVTLAGVRIGRVTAINVDREEYSAVVSMAIRSGYDNLPKDTAASIFTAGLLGAQYIALDPGGDIEYLVEGDVIDITQSALVLENLIGQFLFSQTDKEDK
jgi:phospholipid/cholesterol/gamma-HCH transport system substrate-binding protein